ncbi:hypothetical protein ABTI36_20075, partial [Acinetobacter baumannii]
RGQDLASFRQSWTALGGGVDDSRILTMASGRESHSGGPLWPQGGAAYQNARTVSQCLDDPATCTLGSGVGGVDDEAPLPLLGSRRGGHYWFDY